MPPCLRLIKRRGKCRRKGAERFLFHPVHRYADGDSQSLIDAVNRIGVAEYELSQSLSYNEDGIFISLSAGRQLIDGQKFLDILRYPNYRESDLEQCREGAKLIASYINSRFAAVLGQTPGRWSAVF